MSQKSFRRLVLTGMLAAITVPLLSLAQSKDTKLPFDPNVKKGKLANGLTYYIRPNGKPEHKVELRLAVNAGSILETDEQQGLAHFMEHMNFNGTTNFPKNKLVDFLQSIGVAFGADLNAYTGFDETVYILPIPTDKPGNLESGFQVLEDWAHNATLTEADINDERNVVLEESRSRKGASNRMMQQYLPKMFAGSQYAQRLPIGKDDILKNCKPEAIRSFYRDWYRPDLMAVVVAGDIKVEEAEAMIKKHFAGLKNPSPARLRQSFAVAPYSAAEGMVLKDKEATGYRFMLNFSSGKEEPVLTMQDYRNNLVRKAFLSALNRRLRDLSNAGNPQFSYASVSIGGMARDYENLSINVGINKDISTSVNSALGELVKARTYGFNAAELELVKAQMLSFMEAMYNERNTSESGDMADECIRNFLKEEHMPGIDREYAYYKEMLPGITPQEVSAVAAKWLAKDNDNRFFALLMAPESGTIEVPVGNELKTMVQDALNQQVTANAEKKLGGTLLDKEPMAGKIVDIVKDEQLGTVTYTLSNKVKVTVKKTDFKSDEIMLSAVKKGGGNLYGGKDRSNVNFMADVVESMGYGRFTPTELSDMLAGKKIGLMPSIDESGCRLKGSCGVKDLEALMQLTYLQMTQARKDDALFDGFTGKMKTQFQFLGANPQIAFIDSLGKCLYNNDPRRPVMVPTAADLEQINENRVLEIYKEAFSNADGFHFFLVGNTDEATLKPLLEKYLASLPVKGSTPVLTDNGLRPVTGGRKMEFKKGQEQQSVIMSFYTGEMPFSESGKVQMDMIGQLLTIKVIEQVREEMGAMYSGGFSGSLQQVPYAEFSIQGYMPCGPDNVAPILKRVDEVIAKLKTNGPDQKDLEKVKITMLEKRREMIKTNDYWTAKLEQLLFWDNSKAYFLNFETELNKITAADIKATAAQVLNSNNSFTGILLPE